MKPLLHTWSLGIEEQFYIFYPVILIIISRTVKKPYMSLIFATVVISFALNIYYVYNAPATAFYWIHTRAWELGIGALTSLLAARYVLPPHFAALAGFLGFFMIIASVFLLDSSSLFPGFWALMPCIGTALLIITSEHNNTAITKFISAKIFVFIGKISYSLYLWHYPVFCFKKYWFSIYPKSLFLSDWFLLGVIFVLSLLSYATIEKPFRSMCVKNKLRFFAVTCAAVFALSAIGTYIRMEKGKVMWAVKSINVPSNPLLSLKYHDRMDYSVVNPDFIIGDKNRQPRAVIWGDSHAASVSVGLDSLAEKMGTSIFAATAGSLTPILGSNIKDVNKKRNSVIFDQIMNDNNIDTILLVAAWRHLFNSFSPQELSEMFDSTIETLSKAGKRIYVFTDVPEFRQITNLYAESVQSFTPDQYYKQQKRFQDLLEKSRYKDKFTVAEYQKGLIVDGQYKNIIDGNQIYFDQSHLSRFGSEYLAVKNRDLLTTILK